MYNTHDIYSLVLSLLLCVDKIIREREREKKVKRSMTASCPSWRLVQMTERLEKDRSVKEEDGPVIFEDA